MSYLGDYASGSTVRGKFNTRQSDGTPITLAGSPTLAVYKDSGTTESTAGITLTVDFDGRTGLHDFVVVLSDAFYAAAANYQVVLTAGTVDGVSVVGVKIAEFSIENRSVDAVNSVVNSLDQRLPAALVGGRMDASVGAMAANTLTASVLASDAVDEITLQTANEVFAYEVEGVDNFSVMFEQLYNKANAIEVDTIDIQSRLPAALIGGRMNSSVGAMAANTLTASALATDAVTELRDAITSLLIINNLEVY